MILFSQSPQSNIKNISSAFFNIMKEPLLVQKQTIHQQKALDLSFLETESLRAWHYQEDATPARRKSIFFNANEAENMRSFAEQSVSTYCFERSGFKLYVISAVCNLSQYLFYTLVYLITKRLDIFGQIHTYYLTK